MILEIFFKTDKISKHSSILTVIEKTLKLTNAQLKINDINLKKELMFMVLKMS